MEVERAMTASAVHPIGYGSKVLGPHDLVGATFYIACNMMLASTVFFFVERSHVPKQWGTSVSVAGLVTFVAWYNYTYMKDVWVHTQNSPTVYRYTDWLITVPLQILEFYFILSAVGPVSGSLGFRLLGYSLLMLVSGWLAEVDILSKAVGFVFGMAGWFLILNEVFSGEAASLSDKIGTGASKKAFNTLRLIVSVGWSIYPLGYAMAYIIHGGGWAPNSYFEAECVNVVYNLADLVNKTAFGLCVWAAAKSDVADGAAAPLMA